MGPPQHYYIDFVYTFSETKVEATNLDAISTKNLIATNLKTFFGDSVASIGFDLLRFNESDRRGVIRCPTSSYVKLRSSLCLPARYDEGIVSFRVLKASPLLTALLADSKSYEHKNHLTAKRKLRIESCSDEDEMDTDGS